MRSCYNESALINYQAQVFKAAYGFDPLDPDDTTEDDLEWWDEDDDRRED